jgi:hypothetical protein
MKGPNQYTQFKHIPHVCYACGGTKTTVNGSGSPNWFLNWDSDFNMLCNRCYEKLIYYPKIRSQKLEQYRKLIRFGSMRQLKGTFRAHTGYCSKCPNNIFDGSCKTTHMHHFIYVRILSWFGREELCVSCHSIETWKEWQCMKKRIKR